MRNAGSKQFRRMTPQMNDEQRIGTLVNEWQMNAEDVRASLGWVQKGAEDKSVTYKGFPAALSSHGTKEQRENAEKLARLQLTNTYEGATNKEMQGQVGGALEGSEKLMQNLTELSRKWDLEGLKDVPGLVDKVAASIKNLGVASAAYTGTPYPGGAPPPSIPPRVQGSHATP